MALLNFKNTTDLSERRRQVTVSTSFHHFCLWYQRQRLLLVCFVLFYLCKIAELFSFPLLNLPFHQCYKKIFFYFTSLLTSKQRQNVFFLYSNFIFDNFPRSKSFRLFLLFCFTFYHALANNKHCLWFQSFDSSSWDEYARRFHSEG